MADRSLFYAASPEDASRAARSGQLLGSSAEVELSVQRVASLGGAAVAVRVPTELVRPSDQPDRVLVDREVVTRDRVGRAFQPWHVDVQPDIGQRWKGYLQPEMTLTLRNLVNADTPLPLRQREDEFVELGLAELAVRPVPQTFDLAHLQAIHDRLFGDVYPVGGGDPDCEHEPPGQPVVLPLGPGRVRGRLPRGPPPTAGPPGRLGPGAVRGPGDPGVRTASRGVV